MHLPAGIPHGGGPLCWYVVVASVGIKRPVPHGTTPQLVLALPVLSEMGEATWISPKRAKTYKRATFSLGYNCGRGFYVLEATWTNTRPEVEKE